MPHMLYHVEEEAEKKRKIAKRGKFCFVEASSGGVFFVSASMGKESAYRLDGPFRLKTAAVLVCCALNEVAEKWANGGFVED